MERIFKLGQGLFVGEDFRSKSFFYGSVCSHMVFMTVGIHDPFNFQAVQGGDKFFLSVRAAGINHETVYPEAGGKIEGPAKPCPGQTKFFNPIYFVDFNHGYPIKSVFRVKVLILSIWVFYNERQFIIGL
jgi:hypothetical protein